MTRVRAMVLGGALLLAVPALAAVLVTPNISGDWTLTVVEPNDGCTYVGPLTLAQNGTMFTGSAIVNLVSGTDPPCDPTFSGTVSGTLAGFVIQFGLVMGGGTGTFDGLVGADQLTMSGTWTSAPLSGTWHAERVLGVRAPALGNAGVASLLALLLAAGVHLLRRRAAR